jgi:hypothetical protein
MGKAKTDFIPVRYYTEWHPLAEIEADCAKQGMKPNDGTSFWDWIDINDHVCTRTFRDFDKAVAFAKETAPLDCFGSPRVYRQYQHVVKYGAKSVIRWDDECYWDDFESAPDINKPDQTVM